jgi:hypothetical protein
MQSWRPYGYPPLDRLQSWRPYGRSATERTAVLMSLWTIRHWTDCSPEVLMGDPPLEGLQSWRPYGRSATGRAALRTSLRAIRHWTDCSPDVLMGDPPLEDIQDCWPFATLHIPDTWMSIPVHVAIFVSSLSNIGWCTLPLLMWPLSYRGQVLPIFTSSTLRCMHLLSSYRGHSRRKLSQGLIDPLYIYQTIYRLLTRKCQMV